MMSANILQQLNSAMEPLRALLIQRSFVKLHHISISP